MGIKSQAFRCIYHICWQAHGRCVLTKKGGYYLSCGLCRAQSFLNDAQAVALWRGTQRALEASAELYDLLATQTAALAPHTPGTREGALPGRTSRTRTPRLPK